MFEQFKDLVLSRQSCRDFNDKELSVDTVREIAELAMLSPSACNSQPWKMYLITDKSRLAAVTESLQERGHNKFLSGAKAYIAVTEKQAESLKENISAKFGKSHFVKYDIGELIAYITLAAESMGVSSCIIGWINQDKLREAIGYPGEEVCNIVVSLGYSDIPVREKNRKDKSEIIKEI